MAGWCYFQDEAIGEEGTLEQFNREMGRAVLAKTALPRDKHDGGFEQARNHWFKTGTIGRRFVVGRLDDRVIPRGI
jgi:hypothetical protein